MKTLLYIASLCLKLITISCLTCQDILQAGDERQHTLAELQTAPPKDIVECLAHLSKARMPAAEAEYIWRVLVEHFGGAFDVPDAVLTLLHWVTPALQPEDYANLTLSDPDVIRNFGLDYNLTASQLTAIAHRVRTDFADKEPEDYTYYDLNSLGQILCAFNRSDVERIHPSAFREAAGRLGKLVRCPAEVLRGLAALAAQPSAFGDPAAWTPAVLETLGAVAAYSPRASDRNRSPDSR